MSKKLLRVTDLFAPAKKADASTALFSASVQAGFPSPADEFIEKQLNLHELVVEKPAATFFLRVEGESMQEAGIDSGDILVVDRSKTPAHGKIVVAVVEGEFTVKRLELKGAQAFLVPENPRFPKIAIDPESDFSIWGVVTYVIHKT